MDGEEDAAVGQRGGAEAEGEESPAGDPGEFSVEPVPAGRRGGADRWSAGASEVGKLAMPKANLRILEELRRAGKPLALVTKW